MTLRSFKSFRAAVPILLGLLLLVRLIAMAVAPLVDNTESRYGEIGRKMAELNDWVTPWFDYGVPYWGKPPLAFWGTALSFKLFGVGEFAARLPHLVVALLIVGLVAWLAGRRDRAAALPAVACLAGSVLYFVSAGAVMTDLELTLGTTLAMAGFWLAVGESGAGEARTAWPAAALLFGGLVIGLLAKGPVAVVLAGTPLLLWTAYHRRWRDAWRRLPWLGGGALTLLVVLPWYWLAELRTPGFLAYFIIGEHWHRFVTPGWDGDRYGGAHRFPIGAIWLFAFVGTLPWSVLWPIEAWRWRKAAVAAAPVAARSGPNAGAWQSYLLLWILTPLVFFTAARNVIWTYALPAAPAAAVWAGGWLAGQARRGRDVNRPLAVGLLVTLLLACGAAADLLRPSQMEHKSLKTLVAAYDQASARQAPGAPLIFIKYFPSSGRFYSHGRAESVRTIADGWTRIGAGAAYVATLDTDDFIASAARGTPPRGVSRVGYYGDFDLLFVAPQ